MALIEIKMKVYKSKYGYKNLSPTLAGAQKEEYLKKEEQIAYEDEGEFRDWLEENYNILRIFNMSEEERHSIDKKWRESCREYVEECFKDTYDEEKITLRVEEEELNSHESFRLIGID